MAEIVQLDQNIPLGFKPATQLDPVGAAAKAQQLLTSQQLTRESAAASSQATDAAAQARQEGALKIQQTEQDLKDQQIYADALKQSSAPPPGAPAGAPIAPPDPNAVLMNMMKDPRGLSGKAAQAYMGTMLENRVKQAAAAKDAAQADSDNATAGAKHADAVVGATGSLLAMGDINDPQAEAARAKAYPQMRAQLIAAGHLKESEVPLAYPGGVWLAQEHDQLQTGVQQLAAQKQAADLKIKQLEEDRNAAKAPAELAKAGNEALNTTPNSAGLTPDQQRQADQAAATLAQTTARNAEQGKNEEELRRQGAVRNNIEAGRLKMEQAAAGFGAPAGVVTPAAQMAIDGRMDPLTLRAMLRKNPGLLGQIQKGDPNFDEANIDNRYNTLKEFSSSSNTKAGGQVLALNTLVHHADLYQQVGEALNNGSFKPGNAAYNAVSSMMGSAAPQNAELVARFLAGETGKVATGGVPAEGEINGILKSLGTSSSPQQISDAGKTMLQIAAGRMIPLKEKAQNAKIDSIVPVLGPDAKEILTRRGYDVNTLKPAAAAGGGAGGGHKTGDTRVVGGKTVTRDAQGNWN